MLFIAHSSKYLNKSKSKTDLRKDKIIIMGSKNILGHFFLCKRNMPKYRNHGICGGWNMSKSKKYGSVSVY